jgi:hypothetical protein
MTYLVMAETFLLYGLAMIRLNRKMIWFACSQDATSYEF